MKSLSPNAAVIFAFIGVAILAWTGVCWGDWILLHKTEDAEVYYDKDDVTTSSSGTANVWVKYDYTKQGVSNKVNLLGTKFENLDHSIILFEFDCVGKLVLSLSTVYFSKDKSVIENKELDNNWEFISTGSLFDALYNKVCNK